ncbi:hypothetical protein BV22DRAFT_1130987 [Leucogyrophana mollusca]|uniref:Uncharacterized protein n=1 Tax=Leucogyrophana mollusca TaxID=85980 RepID=A0ACB8BE31_9AGAM|nr:hypothetical protein BV22DRAFT_1130987 [Leucogyrophana mollusca]
MLLGLLEQSNSVSETLIGTPRPIDHGESRRDDAVKTSGDFTSRHTTPHPPVRRADSAQILTSDDLERAVDETISKHLANMPLRLIDTNDGCIYTISEIAQRFKQSSQCRSLLAIDPVLPETREHVEKSVQSYLSYAMLSHRWGNEEPLYQDVMGRCIYEMDSISPGVAKLQRFCRTATDCGFRWAWSDTCCIDKSSSSELQESINSMFLWYRNSCLTIVYLSDVEDFSRGSLIRSEWFRRGWTLQEMLAPRAVQFYKSDWSLLLGSTGDVRLNHKEDPQLMSLLSDVTGIDLQSLKDFKPGLEAVRERLRWASRRTTTKIEDMAYALLGIFDLNLPVLYGEKEKAFTRLQEEIMKGTDDTSLFDWVGKPSKANSCLASHPTCFASAPWTAPETQILGLPVEGLVTSIAVDLTASVVHTLGALLKDPPLGHFIANGRMNMRFFVYPVFSIEHANPFREGASFRYIVQASGLIPLSIKTSRRLESVTGRLSAGAFCVGRLWDNSLLSGPKSDPDDGTAASDSNSGGTHLWDPDNEGMIGHFALWLQQPFVAQLMMAYPGGPFRRIHTEERIIAQPHDNSLLNLRTLIVR